MGDLISMADWKRDHQELGGNHDVMNEVQRLMSRAYVLRQEMPRLPTVIAREKAVVDSLGLTMKAHALARKNGLAISTQPDGTYMVGRYIDSPKENL